MNTARISLIFALVSLLGVLGLGGWSYYLSQKVLEVESRPQGITSIQNETTALPAVPAPPPSASSDSCGSECKAFITSEVERLVAAIPTPKASTTTTVVQQNGTVKTSYIPVGSSLSTTSSAWTNVAGEIYIDPADYGKTPTFSWTVSLKIANSNGEVRARLFDVTHGIAVDGSELSNNTSSYVSSSSGNIPFWSGRNLYRVQIKSTVGQEASIASAQIKVTYK